MNTAIEHAECAADQLRNAEDMVEGPEQQATFFLEAAKVAALLAVAAAVRESSGRWAL